VISSSFAFQVERPHAELAPAERHLFDRFVELRRNVERMSAGPIAVPFALAVDSPVSAFPSYPMPLFLLRYRHTDHEVIGHAIVEALDRRGRHDDLSAQAEGSRGH
jgi:hypothetical protein